MTPAQQAMLATMDRNDRATQLMAMYAGPSWLRTLHEIQALLERTDA